VGDGVDPLATAHAHADLGLPLPRGTRFRFLKRLVARVARLFTSHQIEVNRGLANSVLGLRTALGEAELRVSAAADRLADDLAAVRTELSDLQADLLDGRSEVGLLGGQLAGLEETVGALGGRLERFGRELTPIRNELDASRQRERARQSVVDLFLRQVRRQLPTPPDVEQLTGLREADDEIYEALEDAFRGSFEHVTELLRAYLPDIETVGSLGRVLDIGTGRGEWLQLLANADIDAYGVDSNAVAVERCRSRDLKVVHGDALLHLTGLPDASIAAITGFHVVEHLGSFDALIELIDQAVRVLRPGGLVIFETPNPENVIVGASTFYLDPSHHRPVPPRLLEFLVWSRGFDDVELRFLHPMSVALIEEWEGLDQLRPLVDRLEGLLFGARDYAVLARRVGS